MTQSSFIKLELTLAFPPSPPRPPHSRTGAGLPSPGRGELECEDPGEDQVAPGDLVSPPVSPPRSGLFYQPCLSGLLRVWLADHITAGVQAKGHFISSWESQNVPAP